VAPGEVTLPKLPNLHWFPPVKRYADLAGYLRNADAGLIPYRPDPYAGAMHPAKLNEYLVFGLPVVATATPELKRLAAEWPEKTFYLAGTAEEFGRAVDQAFSENNDELRRRRQNVITNLTWSRKISELLKTIS